LSSTSTNGGVTKQAKERIDKALNAIQRGEREEEL
jgi:hypothetical protein